MEAAEPALAVTELLGDLGPVPAAPAPAPRGAGGGRSQEGGTRVGGSGGQQTRRVTAGAGRPARGGRGGSLTERHLAGPPQLGVLGPLHLLVG